MSTRLPSGSKSTINAAPTSTMTHKNEPLAGSFPVNSYMELTVDNPVTIAQTGKGQPKKDRQEMRKESEIIRGTIYTTDEISESIVLLNALHHTTLSSEVRIINANCVSSKRIIRSASQNEAALGSTSENKTKNEDTAEDDGGKKTFTDVEVDEELLLAASKMATLSVSSPAAINRKDLEDRERRAIKLAIESFGHINQTATPEGQQVFDRLVKACNEVVWKGESIVVLNQVRVDPPYRSEDCKVIDNAMGGNLERVKRIVVGNS